MRRVKIAVLFGVIAVAGFTVFQSLGESWFAVSWLLLVWLLGLIAKRRWAPYPPPRTWTDAWIRRTSAWSAVTFAVEMSTLLTGPILVSLIQDPPRDSSAFLFLSLLPMGMGAFVYVLERMSLPHIRKSALRTRPLVDESVFD